MIMEKKSIYPKHLCMLLIFGVLICMVLGSFFDYGISQALFNESSVFGIFLASYGQLPGMLCFSVAGLLMIKIADKTQKIKSILSYIFGILLNVFAILGITLDPMLYIPKMSVVLSVVIALVIVLGVNVLMWNLTKGSHIEDVKKMIWLLLLAMLMQIIIINIVKIPWGRPRMRMISKEPLASFQPWWVIGSEMKDALMTLGVAAEEFKSFPSGHTGNATCALLLGALPLICPKLKGKETLMFSLGIAFTLLVAVSRIMMGAHFLTDVTVGFVIAFSVQLALIRFIFGKK